MIGRHAASKRMRGARTGSGAFGEPALDYVPRNCYIRNTVDSATASRERKRCSLVFPCSAKFAPCYSNYFPVPLLGNRPKYVLKQQWVGGGGNRPKPIFSLFFP
jgi:hypothetical protein